MTVFKEIATNLLNKRAEKGLTNFKYNISACLFDDNQLVKTTTRNDLPPAFASIFAPTDQLGDSSPTIHAEIFALQSGVACDGLSIAISDPPCPNCAKQIIMSGIRNIYILDDGFTDGLWYNSIDENNVARKRYFDDLSLVLAKHAGVGVYEINAEGEVTRTFAEPGPRPEKGVPMNSANCAFAKNDDGEEARLYEQYTYGMNAEKAEMIRDDFTDVEGGLRYRLMIDPLSNLLAHCAKYGKPLAAEEVYITEIPTSRCIVNAVGAGVEHLFVPKKYQALYGKSNAATRKANLSRKTSYALKALSILEDKGTVKVTFKDL